VASQAGLVLANAGLIEDLQASRQRIVAAPDEARRRLERNIHDGAQQDLVTVEADGIGRFGQDTEAAVYFCCLEALQNTAKPAQASSAQICLQAQNGTLRFTVSDDGAGYDVGHTPVGSGLRNMADRLAAVGGRLEVRSAPSQGTTIAGYLPLPATTGGH
jgi:signal transduction histidine kinase